MNTRNKLLCAALLAVSAPVWADQTADLQGKWHCLTRYDDINAETRDHIHFSANGTVKTQGKMIFKFNGHEFHYSLPSRGTWQLQDNLLTLKLTDGKLQRKHPAATRQAIAKDETMRLHDKMTAHILSDRKPDEKFYLRIDELTPDTMRQTQLAEDNLKEEMAKTVCTRREKDLPAQ